MAETKPNTIKTIIDSTHQHLTRDVGRGGYDYSNLSDFVCTCGQKFISSSDREPREVPSMPALHKADAVAQALGLSESFLAQGPADLHLATPYATIIDAQALMMRRTESSEVNRAWYTQSGDYLATTEINFPARLIWATEL